MITQINWLHIPKVTASRTLENPYFLLRTLDRIWNGTEFVVTDTYTDYVIRPTWLAGSNIYLFTLPQAIVIDQDDYIIATLSMFDEASPTIDDLVKWSAMVTLVNVDGVICFYETPVIG